MSSRGALAEEVNPPKALFGIVMLCVFLYTHWLFNIFLFHILPQDIFKGKKRFIRYVLSYGMILLVAMTFLHIKKGAVMDNVGFVRYYPLFSTVANNSIMLIIFSLVKERHKRNQLALEKAELAVEHERALKENLKHNIHPHFLFNTLFTLKLLIKKNQTEAERYLKEISMFLRQSLTDKGKDMNLVEDEIAHSQRYFNIQKVRFSGAIFFEVDVSDHVRRNKTLPVFALQSMVENAIKHNAFSEQNPLVMRLYEMDDGALAFTNNHIPKNEPVPSTRVGLKNLEQRFSFYGKDYLKIDFKPEEYFTLIFRAV